MAVHFLGIVSREKLIRSPPVHALVNVILTIHLYARWKLLPGFSSKIYGSHTTPLSRTTGQSCVDIREQWMRVQGETSNARRPF